jgi:GNAT superfamily N-acetyltransferase
MHTRREMTRIVELMRVRDEAAAERIVRLDGITALLDTRLPDVWDANWLRVENPGASAERVVAAGEETIGAAGMAHRTAWSPDPSVGERLLAELAPHGWEAERGVYMALAGGPDRPADQSIAVEETGHDAVAHSRAEFLREDLSDWYDPVTPAIVDQYLRADRTWDELAGDRWFAAREDGRVVAFCRLLEGGGTGQVEEVGTLPSHRNRGYARAVVLAAVAASVAAGHDLTFIGAYADDWPRRLYARLGFDEIGEEVVLYRRP